MKHKTGTKAMSWLLSLVMVLGLMPGMSLTAHAETYDSNVDKLQEGDILEPGAEFMANNKTIILQANGWCTSEGSEEYTQGTEDKTLENLDMLRVLSEDDRLGAIEDAEYNKCYPCFNGAKADSWKVVSVEGGDEPWDSQTITLTGYAETQSNNPFTSSVYYRQYDSTGTQMDNGTIAANAGILIESDTKKWVDGKTYIAYGTVTIDSRVKVTGTVNLILLDGASLTTRGIDVKQGNTLNIYAGNTTSSISGSGKLTAAASGSNAGIGSGSNDWRGAGTVNIHGGNITATGDENGAGIGGGDGGAVNIYDGSVIAQGGELGAGIGGGYSSPGGTVTIYGGTVTATGGESGAGIGGGKWESGGTVSIYGGTVTASGGNKPGWGNVSDSMGIGKGCCDDSSKTAGTLTLGTGVSMSVSADNSTWSAYDGITRAQYMKTGSASVAVTGMTLAPSDAQTVTVGESVAFTATVTPDAATDKTVVWSVGGTNADTVKLYSDEACANEIGTDAIETLTVYAKGISTGNAIVIVTSNADSSKSASCDVTVNAASYNVTITQGSNMTKTENSGAASQNGLTGAMTPVVYTANEGYYFPEQYDDDIEEVDGISVTRDSYAQITVSGTPTADAAIMLTAPTAKKVPATGDFYYSDPGSIEYDGTQKAVSVEANEPSGVVGMGEITVHYYSVAECDTSKEVQNPTDAGTYYVGITVTEGDAYKAVSTVLHDASWQFTINMANQTAPAAPTKASATINSITLNTITNGEYKRGDGKWQTDPTFTGLAMNTEYTFYQRLKEDGNHNASPSSTSATIITNDHVHEWSYEANSATITATCADTDGGHGETKTATLTLAAPTLTIYGQTGTDISEVATLTGLSDFNTVTGLNVQTSSIVYWNAKIQEGVYKTDGDQPLTAAPTSAGNYLAKITVNNCIASVGYTIAKAAGDISYATESVSKTYGEAAFTNELTKTGDGTVSYASNNTGVATVDSSTGEVTIVGAGEATITATVTDGTNYAYVTKDATYTITVNAATMTVSAEGYTGTYDSNPHSITVTVTTPADGATITYGTTNGTYDLNENPAITNVSDSKTVYFKVTAPNYADYTDSAAVTISRANQETPEAPTKASATINSITLTAITNGEYKCGNGAWQTSPTFNGLTMNTEYTFYQRLKEDDNHNASPSSTSATISTNDHVHEWSYEANSATITATCADTDSGHGETKTVTLTIVAPTLTTYGGEGSAEATLNGLEAFNTATGKAIATTDIKYVGRGGTIYEESATAPTNTGKYTAKITVESKIAQIDYEIGKAAGSISYATASVNKTYGDEPFTNALNITGDGIVTYSTNNDAVAIDATDGKVTIVGAGEATITATVADGTNYAYATKTATYTITVNAATMTVSAEGYTGTYDSNPHSITVTVTTPADGATITYGTTNGTYDLNESPAITNVSDSKTVYFKVTAPNYADYTGSAAVTISRANQETPTAPTKASATINSITLTAITNGEYSMDGENWQDSPTFTGLTMNTQYTFYQRYASDANHNASPSSTSATISTNDHTHNFTFSYDQNTITDTITATCTADDCPLENKQISLKLVPPESLVYSQSNPMKARLEGLDAFNEATGLNVSENDIIDIYLPVCEPYGIGSHTAIIILGDEHAPDAAASLKYEISKGMTAIFPTSFFSSPVYGDEDEVYYGIIFSAQPDQDYAITEFGKDVDWENDKVELEPDEDGDGYYFTVKNLEAATKYTVHSRVKAQGENPAGEVKTKDFLTGLSSYHIEGASIVGATLEAMYEPETATGLSYQWYYETRNYNDEEKTSYTSEYSEITDATGKTYTLTEKDIGKFIGVKFIKYDQVIEECSKDGEISQYSTVEFELNYEGGEIEAPTELGYGDKIPEPETPTRAGYVFGGWYADYELTEKWDFEENTIDSDYVVIYAKWTPIYVPTPITTVTVPVSGDAGEESISVKLSGDKVILDSITDAQIASAIGEDGKNFTIDLTGVNGNYEFEISKAAGEKMADAVGEDGKAVIWLKESSGGTDAFYGIEAPASFSKGSRFWVRHIEPTDSTLTDAVRDYYSDNSQHEQWIIDAGMTSDGKEVHDLGGNTVNLYIAVGDDWNADDMRAVFISEDGKTENVVCEPETVVNQSGEHRYARLELNHFSTYILRNMKDCPINEFTDADANAWYHDGVHYVLENELMSGYGNGKFGPADYTSRAMVAQILWNLEGKPASTYEMNYTDVAEDAWYADAIRWASEKGIVTGYGDGKFGPDDNITREQLAAIIYRYAQSKGQGFTGMWMFNLDYEDAASISDWASEAMHWMVMKGIIKGQTDRTLAPKSFASRAEIATMIMRYATLEK